MARTYLPTLLLIAKALNKYAGRWYEQICVNCTPTQKSDLDALIVCLGALIGAIDNPESL